MRIISKSAKHFYAMHKGAHLDIERETDGRFYIIVRWKDGSLMYDGWAPTSVTTFRQAKAEALHGAGLTCAAVGRGEEDSTTRKVDNPMRHETKAAVA